MSELFDRIESAEHIALIAHVDPDADSLGSASAMYTHLLRVQKKASLFCATERMDPRLAFLPWFDKVRSRLHSSVDLAICFDCASAERLGTAVPCDLINIDHHVSNGGYGMLNVVDTRCISTTQVLFESFRRAGAGINAKMATALYAGLLDDSHAFLSPEVDEAAFAMAAELIACGADASAPAKALFQTASLAGLRLKGRMLETMQLRSQARIALLCVTREMLEATGAKAVDCEAALSDAMTLPTVESALMLSVRADGSLKGSLRSGGSLDVSRIALEFGGGGHRRSAGFEANAPMAELAETVIKRMQEEMD